jgi:hypothetical protein
MHGAEEMCIASLAWFNRTDVGRQEQFKPIFNLIDCVFLVAYAGQPGGHINYDLERFRCRRDVVSRFMVTFR